MDPLAQFMWSQHDKTKQGRVHICWDVLYNQSSPNSDDLYFPEAGARINVHIIGQQIVNSYQWTCLEVLANACRIT